MPTSPFSLQAGMARAKAVFLLATDTSCPRGDSETWSSKHLPGPRVPFPQRNLAQFHPEKEVQEEEEGRVTPSQPSFKGLCAPPPVCRALVLLGEGADGSHSTPGAWLRGPVWHVADPGSELGAQNLEGGREEATGKRSPVLVISATPPLSPPWPSLGSAHLVTHRTPGTAGAQCNLVRLPPKLEPTFIIDL